VIDNDTIRLANSEAEAKEADATSTEVINGTIIRYVGTTGATGTNGILYKYIGERSRYPLTWRR
jgi:hypothetical protein